MSVNSKSSKRSKFANLTMPIDENSPSDRELVLGEKSPFDVVAKRHEAEINKPDLQKSGSTEVDTIISTDLSTEKSSDIETLKSADLKDDKSINLNADESRIAETNIISDSDKSDSKKITASVSNKAEEQMIVKVDEQNNIDLKKSESITVETIKSTDSNTDNSKKAPTDSSLQVDDTKPLDSKKSGSKKVGTLKSKKVNTDKSTAVVTDKSKEVYTDISKKADTIISLNVDEHRLIPSAMLPTRKKRAQDADEKSKQKHLPPGKAHLTANIDSKLHGRMKLFALINDILLTDVAESGMGVWMDILEIPNIASIVKDDQTLTDAVVSAVRDLVNKKNK